MKILCVVGARPNFMKVAPVHRELLRRGHGAPLIHTGQHYDKDMSQIFFEELGLAAPDINLGAGGGTHSQQTARIMASFEPVLADESPDMVLVAGDVNSTLACALVAAQRGCAIAHLEAGLRSFRRSMPEEINRVVTDQLSSLLLTPSTDADENLEREGFDCCRIKFVGNAMIDSLMANVERARTQGRNFLEGLGVRAKQYALITLHRPVNVDSERGRAELMTILHEVSREIDLLFPMHPRTRASFGDKALRKLTSTPGIRVLEPLGYLDFIGLQAESKLILTDSGGVQEESTALGVPCLTMRDETERPVTVSEGSSTLVGRDCARIVAAVREIIASGGKAGSVPRLWDGQTAVRVVDALETYVAEAACA